MRKFVFIIILFLGAAFVYLSFGELQTILRTLQQGNFWFILIALIVELGWFAIAGLTFRSLYHVLGIDETVYKLSLLTAAANFVNIVAPSAGMGGMAIYISNAHKRGLSRGQDHCCKHVVHFSRLHRLYGCTCAGTFHSLSSQ